ncbi:MAG: hypothetical protein GX963_04170 [Bacteroidales bacterium]|nr:hypothetical protein [Bacteroidales bacterium]
MTIEVLIATMDQEDHSLLEKMNIQSNAIVGNQCGRNEVEEIEYEGHKIKFLSFNERGVGLNRNNALRLGAARVAFKRQSVTKHGISFNFHFDGVAEYSTGEDTLFLAGCLRKTKNCCCTDISGSAN